MALETSHFGSFEFENNAPNILRQLFQDKSYADVTLVCSDGKVIRAHKAVMAPTLRIFEDLFKTNNTNNLVIFMNDISSLILAYIIEYIYQGKVKVPKISLKNFSL